MIKLWHMSTRRELGYIKAGHPLTWLYISQDSNTLLASGSDDPPLARVINVIGLDNVRADDSPE
jgi:hypothetical protein